MLGPPVRARLGEAVDAVSDVGDTYPASRSRARLREWNARLRAPRLALSQELSAVAHRDPLPPLPANVRQARLLRGVALLMDHSEAREPQDAHDLRTADARLLHSLLCLGELHHRWTRHNGLPEDRLPAFRYERFSGLGDTIASHSGTGTQSVGRTGDEVYSNTIAHESVHAAQFNRLDRGGDSQHFEFHAPRADTEGHARAGFLEAARGVPLRSSLQQVAESNYAAYTSRPAEMQAYLEEAVAIEIAPRLPDGRYADSTDIDLPLDRLSALLLDVARAVQDRASEGRTVFDPERHPEVAAEVESVLLAVADLEEARRSKAWSASTQDDLDEALDALEETCASPASPSDGSHPLREIKDALVEFLRSLQAAAGDQVHSPADVRASWFDFEEVKTRPVKRLARQLSEGAFGGAEIDAGSLAHDLAHAVESAGFFRRVDALALSHGEGAAISPESVGKVVMRLVCALLGLRPKALPAGLMPAVNLYDAPSRTLPFVEGLNEVHGRTRKAQFEIMTWQMHVPRHLLDDPDRLKPRLARLAADAAYAAAALRRADLDARDDRKAAAVSMGASITNNLDVLSDLWRRVWTDPGATSDSAGVRDYLDHLVQALPPIDRGVDWHEGSRTGIKRRQLAAAESREAYHANALKRWALPAVAWRRAVASAAMSSPASSASE